MRYAVAILGLLLLLGGLAAVKVSQISMLISAGKAAAKNGPPPESVASATSERRTWNEALDAIGTLNAARGVVISNEMAGIVSAISFESGQDVQKGQVLVELDSSVERAQLASAAAKLDLAGRNAGRSERLVSTETIARSQLDADLSLFASSRADLGAFRAQIGRKIVRAPFTGRLGIRAVNLGQYVSPGATITVLEDIDTVFADFSLPQRQLESVAIGMPISLVIDGADGPQGSVAAIEPAIDASTRMMKLRASVPNQDHKLRPGMFVRVSVALPGKEEVVTVPATAIIHAPYGDSVFVLEDKPGAKTKDDKQIKIARQRFVRMGESRGDFVSIASGLDAGLEVVTAGGFKLRNNAAVVVNNDVRATPEESPRPQNR